MRALERERASSRVATIVLVTIVLLVIAFVLIPVVKVLFVGYRWAIS